MMTGPEFQIVRLSDPRLAAHALSPSPAWLWSADASRILWANPVAAAIFDADSPARAAALELEPQHPARAQIARIAGTLPQGGAPRLERLRGFGASLGGALICLCARATLQDGSAGILVTATEPAGITLSLREQAHRLLKDFNTPVALFTADGEWIDGAAQASERLGGMRDLVTLGAEKLAREATINGHAEGEIAAGQVSVCKLGAGPTFLLMLSLPAAPAASEPAAETSPLLGTPTAGRPLRFVWQMDAASRFTQGAKDFARLLGPKAGAQFDKPWPALAAELKLNAAEEIARALASHETWSGIVVHWPVDEGERLPIELSGLPVFDRDRQFIGFRGFGVVRDMERLVSLEKRRAQTQGEAKPPNVVAPPVNKPAEEKPLPTKAAPTLSPVEHSAFQELARELGERLKNPPAAKTTELPSEPFIAPAPPPPPAPAEPPRAARNGDAKRDAQEGRPILEKLPVGILVYRLSNLLYANRAFLDWTGYPSLEALNEAGGLDALFIETKQSSEPSRNGARTLTIATVNGGQKPVEGRLFSVAWNNENALVLMINTQAGAGEQQARLSDAALRKAESENQELKAILDTATDGVLVIDRAGRILSANRSAQALFGYEAGEFGELTLGDLFAPESRRPVLDYLDRVARAGGVGGFDAGRETIGRVKQGGLTPLYMTMGRIEDGEKLCAVLRDVTAWKRNEEELINARQDAERASTAKSEFLAKISHEIRTPLNAIIGFSEVMMEERFGPVGNDRYKQYLKDIHSSGSHLISLVNDLLDLSKIEAGKLDLSFVSVNLNDLVQQCVAILQPEANRERVIIRTALPPNLPQVVADARSVRQIALNLLSNSIKFTGAGGQVIVSTTLTDEHEVILRVRDTGSGMSEKDLQTALEPFRQVSVAARRVAGTGLGLPITKALAEANHARFRITSRVDDGTLVEVAFPATRVLAQ